MTREQAVDIITANLDCWAGGDLTLNSMSDEQMQTVLDKALNVNTYVPEDEDMEEEDMDEEEDMEYAEPPTKNERRPMTTNELLASLPAEYVENMQHASKIVAREKRKLVQQLTANISDPARKAARTASMMAR